ncbi:hypothetical protein HU200_031502 [Digitaria exilis]|uniref:(+)-neomenthol dehydrogenase-like n=1 Tax=Digitaria exilis TaxID=1010633 RepID=A0A835BY29_9POAL|nr:hypothetical protein HU200_031502 [Digitaria exilis]
MGSWDTRLNEGHTKLLSGGGQPEAVPIEIVVCTLMEGTISNSTNTRIAVVTGGNKGIGLEVCRQLAGNGVTVVLTARDETRGEAAVEKLREQGISDVIFHQLEVTDASSIACLAEFLKTRFGRVDILNHRDHDDLGLLDLLGDLIRSFF